MALEVLIVDDDWSFRRLLEIRLTTWRKDVSVTSAASLAEAREIVNPGNREFHLAILDQYLPDGLGVELFDHPHLRTAAVLAISADPASELPAITLRAGAGHFLRKDQVKEPLFIPLLSALVERKSFERQAIATEVQKERLETIQRLIGTLQHEINNPLGALIGGAYLLRSSGQLDDEQTEMLKLVEQSAQRIKHVMNQLCDETKLNIVEKGREALFHIPGDKAWDKDS